MIKMAKKRNRIDSLDVAEIKNTEVVREQAKQPYRLLLVKMTNMSRSGKELPIVADLTDESQELVLSGEVLSGELLSFSRPFNRDFLEKPEEEYRFNNSFKPKQVVPSASSSSNPLLESFHTNSENAVEPSSPLSSDFKHMYEDGLYSDVTLHCEGKSFSAHKNILAARSPVFRAMFAKEELSESRSGVVDIKDIDSETVDRMLVFLYSGFLADIQFEDASALHYAADKYNVASLKKKCANVLKAGLAVDNACDLLDLADTHSDQELLKCIVDFIRDHQEVVSSTRWEKLEGINSRLTSKITRELFLSCKCKKPRL